MATCNWNTDPKSGAEILMVEGVEKVRISDAANMRADQGRPGASHITVDELKAMLEKEFGCASA